MAPAINIITEINRALNKANIIDTLAYTTEVTYSCEEAIIEFNQLSPDKVNVLYRSKYTPREIHNGYIELSKTDQLHQTFRRVHYRLRKTLAI